MAEKPPSTILYLLGWPVMGAAICAGVGAAISVVAIQQFAYGYWLFGIAGIAALLHWYVADPVSARRNACALPAVRKYTERLRRAKRNYYIVLIAGIATIVIAILFFMKWTRWTQLDFEKDQVAEKLEVTFSAPPGGDVMDSVFSVKNGSDFDISSRHQITCMVNLIVDKPSGYPMVSNMLILQFEEKQWAMGNPIAFTPGDQKFPIKAHGDAQTDSCLAAIHGPQIACADIFVDFSYSLTNQPALQDHRQRIVLKRDAVGNIQWYGQPKESKEDYCYPFLSSIGKQARDRDIRDGVVDFSKDHYWESRWR